VHDVHNGEDLMGTKAKGVRISDALEREIERESEDRGKSWSAMTSELLEEAIRMRRAPGILFADGPAGRRAVVAGTGLDVWEVIATWRGCKEEEAELRKHYPWLTEPQLRAALSYYRLYPQEIENRLEREAQWTAERIWSELPFARPHNR
jgi:uncharacterized protein (DUF433 family)